MKSLSKFIRVCQSLSCFWSTAFTTIRFQCGFSGKLVFSGINHASENLVYAYFFFIRYSLSILHSLPKKNILRYYISHVIPCSRAMLSQMSYHSSVPNFCTTKYWSLFSSKMSLFFKSFQTSQPLKTLGIATCLHSSPRSTFIVIPYVSYSKVSVSTLPTTTWRSRKCTIINSCFIFQSKSRLTENIETWTTQDFMSLKWNIHLVGIVCVNIEHLM